MKLLIADDDPTTRIVLRSTLTQIGDEVEVACDGNQAWSALQKSDAPQLAILDWMMPGMTGPEICRKVRALGGTPYTYIILLTGLDQIKDLVLGMEAGADDFISKPFQTEVLRARLRAGRRVLDLQHQLLDAHRALETLATHDSLTGLFNRAATLDLLCRDIERSGRENGSTAVILLDLDNFKLVNDTYGHAAGDRVLKESAERMTEAVRGYDFVGRYGGEEFLIVAPRCDLREGVQLAERLRRLIAETPVIFAQNQLTVTASLGITLSDPGRIIDVNTLINRADRALYRAKAKGRNRVEWASVDEESQASLLENAVHPPTGDDSDHRNIL